MVGWLKLSLFLPRTEEGGYQSQTVRFVFLDWLFLGIYYKVVCVLNCRLGYTGLLIGTSRSIPPLQQHFEFCKAWLTA